MNVCDNLGDHLMGNVYIKFVKESSAKPCVEALNNRWYGKNSCICTCLDVTLAITFLKVTLTFSEFD